MWPFSQAATKEKLQGWKKVRVNGWVFVIRKLNPLLDFPGDRMPQIFSEAISRKPNPTKPVPGTEDRAIDDFKMLIHKGVVSPSISLKEDGKTAISVDDLLRDGDTAPLLYTEIIAHSLQLFRGVKGLFFWARTKHSLATAWRKSMESGPPILPSTTPQA